MSGDAKGPLSGAEILVAEDEALIALELFDALGGAGARVVGPLSSLPDVLRAAEQVEVAAAVLDIDLRGQTVFPAAEVLAARGIPFVFHTGNVEHANVAGRFADAPVCLKPLDQNRLIGLLADLARRSDAPGPAT